ncbi:replication initiation factor domain-containing protein [Microcoleus sp. F8-D3]
MMQTEFLDRKVRVDWLRFQFKSESSNCLSEIIKTLDLPFQPKNESLFDAKNSDILALNKVWHDVYEYEGSLTGVNYAPSAGVENFHRYFVDLSGKTLAKLDFSKIQSLLYWAQCHYDFIANRIDVAVDFPVRSPRLSLRHWESFIEDGLLAGYRTARRIMNVGSRHGTTVYLGSRESDRFVRIYDKNIDGIESDRIELELKRFRAQTVMRQIADLDLKEISTYLDNVVCGQINFVRSHPDIDFFRFYKRGAVMLAAPVLHCDIERSIAFIQRHSPTFAMLHQFMGEERFQEFMANNLRSGKLQMKPRHHRLIQNAQSLLSADKK